MDANWLLTSTGKKQGRLAIEARFAGPTDDVDMIQNDLGLWVKATQELLAPRLMEAIKFIDDHTDLPYAECERLAVEAGVKEITFKRAWRTLNAGLHGAGV